MLAFIGPTSVHVIMFICTIVYAKMSIYPWVILGDLLAGVTGGGMTEHAMQMAMVTDAARDKVSVAND